jgi:Ca2+-binding EF-hand superfamily protein
MMDILRNSAGRWVAVSSGLILFFAIICSAEAQLFGGSIDSMIDKRFKEADKNKDGKLTLDEAKEGMPRVAKNFSQLDAERRGYVTVEQIKKAVATQGGSGS